VCLFSINDLPANINDRLCIIPGPGLHRRAGRTRRTGSRSTLGRRHTHTHITAVRSLSRGLFDAVAGIKYALKDPIKLGAGISAGSDDVVWVDGLAEPFAVSYWAEGVEGFSAGVSNFRPEVGLELFDALSSGDWERARTLRNICLPYQNFRDRTGQNNAIAGAISVPAVKKGLELAGLHGGSVREPIRPLASEEETRAEEIYGQLDDDISRLID